MPYETHPMTGPFAMVGDSRVSVEVLQAVFEEAPSAGPATPVRTPR